jgi:ribonuclease PH
MRTSNRAESALRPIHFELGFTKNASGSVLARCGNTVVLCTCSVENSVPAFLVGKGKGWITAEYAMLPGSTQTRKAREKAGKVDGRSIEIQRLIGRSLRAVLNLDQLGERTLWLDCDVIDADGGTRTTAINGAFVALCLAFEHHHDLKGLASQVIRDSVGAMSVGIIQGVEYLDLEYVEDVQAQVDMNLVMTGSGEFIEIQGTGEGHTFTQSQLFKLIDLGKKGIAEVTQLQKQALGSAWPLS